MGKEKTEFEEQFSIQNRKNKKIYGKNGLRKTRQLSMESVQWNGTAHKFPTGIHAIRICIDSLPKAGR